MCARVPAWLSGTAAVVAPWLTRPQGAAAGHGGRGDTCGRGDTHDPRLAPLWPKMRHPAGARGPELPVTLRERGCGHRGATPPPGHPPGVTAQRPDSWGCPKALQGCDSSVLGTIWPCLARQVGFGAGVARPWQRLLEWMACPLPVTSIAPSLLFVAPLPPPGLSRCRRTHGRLLLTPRLK